MDGDLYVVPQKPWYTSKTVWLNAIGFSVMVIGIVLDNAGALDLPPHAVAYLGVLLAILNGALRFFSYQPIGGGTAFRTLEQTHPDGRVREVTP